MACLVGLHEYRQPVGMWDTPAFQCCHCLHANEQKRLDVERDTPRLRIEVFAEIRDSLKAVDGE